MQLPHTLSRKSTLVLTASLLVLVLGSGLAYANEQGSGPTTANDQKQKVFTSSYEFQVYDPSEPVISTSVAGTFINTNLNIAINMSSHDGVKELDGTYTVVVQLYNDTSGSYQPFKTLVTGKSISLTPTPTTVQLPFTTNTPGTYNVDVEFTTVKVVLA